MAHLPEGPWPTRLERVPLPLDAYLALPEWPRAEYVDGVAIFVPLASRGHNRVQRHLARLIEEALPLDRDVRTDAGWVHAGRYRVPDIAVFTTRAEVVYDESLPILVVEVLSPSTASEDTVRKSTEYLRAGIPRYWIVDRDHRVLLAFAAADDGWELVTRLDEAEPRGSLSVGEHGEVVVDLDVLLRP